MSVGTDFYRLDDLLSDAERAARDQARRWVTDRVMAEVRQHYRDGTMPFHLKEELAALGAFGGFLRGYGCAGLSAIAYGLVMQELERADSGLRTFAAVQGALCMTAIHRFGSEEQKQRWLPLLATGRALGCFALTEPDFGSDPAGMQTRATRIEDGWELSGSKMWIGNASSADVAVIWAKADGDGADAVRGFLVEKGTTGFTAEVMQGKMSLRVGETCRIHLQRCHLPEQALLPNSQGLKSPLSCLNHARYGISWGVVGAAQACFEEARDYAMRRVQFGRPIASFQLVQAKLARMLTEVTRAQLLAFRLGQLKEAGQATPAQISMAKRSNVETALEVAHTARDILGGVGILDDYHCFRHLCNLESVRTYEGTHDMHLLILGKEITGISAFV